MRRARDGQGHLSVRATCCPRSQRDQIHGTAVDVQYRSRAPQRQHDAALNQHRIADRRGTRHCVDQRHAQHPRRPQTAGRLYDRGAARIRVGNGVVHTAHQDAVRICLGKSCQLQMAAMKRMVSCDRRRVRWRQQCSPSWVHSVPQMGSRHDL